MKPATKPLIALPQPCSYDLAYSRRVLPEYEHAIKESGGEPVLINPRMTLEEIISLIASCSGILLTSSPADVDPQKYGSLRETETADPDPLREALDAVLLQDAYRLHKPVFGICYGLQSLNVWNGGTLDQQVGPAHQDDKFHPVTAVASLKSKSLLTRVVGESELVQSKHRQAAKEVRGKLQVTFTGPGAVIEAIEGTQPEQHYVVAVQWHPEREFEKESSKKIFHQFIEATRNFDDNAKKMKKGVTGFASVSSIRIARSKTTDDWKAFRGSLVPGDNASPWQEAFSEYFYARISSRYLEPIGLLQKHGAYQGEGFSIAAIHCSLIEFLESTLTGESYRYHRDPNKRPHTYDDPQKKFVDFLTGRNPFRKHFDKTSAKEFYFNVRCGLLHEAQTKGGWRISGSDPGNAPTDAMISYPEKIVYRNNFHKALLKFIDDYKYELLSNRSIQVAFKRKFDSLCA